MEFDLSKLLSGDGQNATQTTSTGRVYTTLAERDGVELKFNVDMLPTPALTVFGMRIVATVVIRLVQNRTPTAPDFGFDTRSEQPEQVDDLYRYMPQGLPLCFLGPSFHLRHKWESQGVTAKLREFLKAKARRMGATVTANDDQIDGALEAWMVGENMPDPDLFNTDAKLD